jgi:hypothetical protein
LEITLSFVKELSSSISSRNSGMSISGYLLITSFLVSPSPFSRQSYLGSVVA